MKRNLFVIGSVVAICIVAVILACTLTLLKRSTYHPLVMTDCGLVEGTKTQVTADNGQVVEVNEYLNIPYAAAPTGDLRWKAPVGLKQHGSCWKGTLKRNKKIVKCVQAKMVGVTFAGIEGVEDCLVINVWAPVTPTKKNLPVLLWLHGGGMISGHGRTPGYHADSQLAASIDVVTVSINYRLNLFGFLSIKELWSNSTDGGYGNYGVMDQILALRWIKANINNFGGDPNDVTIIGESGGGTAAFCLLSASLGVAKGLFHKMIAMSGVPHIKTTHTEADMFWRKLIKRSNCQRSTDKEIAKCLRHLSINDVILKGFSFAGAIPRDYRWQFPFNKPLIGFPLQTIDPIVVKYSPSHIPSLLKSIGKENMKVDILMGNMAQEPNFQYGPKLNWTDMNALRKWIEPRINSFKPGLYPTIMNLYANRSPNKFTPLNITPYYVYSSLTADVILSCDTTKLAYELSKHSSSNVYSYIVSQPFTPVVTPYGVIPLHAEHAMDTTALFGFRAMNAFIPGFKPSKDDLKLKKNLRDTVRSFIYSNKTFASQHKGKTMEFWNSSIHTWSNPYHEKECKVLRDNGFLKHTWGNIGVYNSTSDTY